MDQSFSSRASDDLDEIYVFIATDSRLRAVTFTDELVRRCEMLVSMPEAFPLLPRYEHFGIRRRVYSGYSIIYRYCRSK